MPTQADKGISIIMPTYKQEAFITRALASLQAQTFQKWELLLINDGSPDDTERVISPYLADERIRYWKHVQNVGLGASLNEGLREASYNFIAYLPSDDVYYKEHLQSLFNLLQENPAAVLAFSGVRHHYNRTANGKIEGFPLQLVQVLHRKTADIWLERDELVTDDLERMYWGKLGQQKAFVSSAIVTCEWVDHPAQRYKILQEPEGGINPYKLYYNVRKPLRFHTTVGNFIDEEAYFKPFRDRPDTPMAEDGLKILLVGELAYNSERVLALEEQGHKLYGLWMREPYWYNTVGPLPFGHVEDIPYENWVERVREIQPDVLYALLNWQAVPFAHEVLMHNLGIPFVWHYKEGPFINLEKGTWNELIDLYTKSDGQIYTSDEMRDWFEQYLPHNSEHTLILDGDLPKKEWFSEQRSPLLSEKDGEVHTVVPGRPIGLHPETVVELAENGVHLHFYGDFTHGQWKKWIERTMSMAPGYLHIHSNCSQDRWVEEFSQYDAGWLHFFQSENNGELMRSNWDDLNIPARMATLAVAGLPMLQRDNTGHMVATQSLVKKYGLGLFFSDMSELGKQLYDRDRMKALRDNVWKQRMLFAFDTHVEELVQFFRSIIKAKKNAVRYNSIFPAAVEVGDTTATAHHDKAV
ncbi:glycosyltransferase involved in cell wall biosynthesis [Pontibacter ummariensis]|uniref:Glycosyltransferase involved in cell wall bisynthesis n=1 Tax=Pontibacter ummariensis TaxID=1610492 RepID=A0A239FF29_9BACT|nr:glycosyltransferase family 2 protein [Pontibacter ummariensis]PRY12288.1 glycosyltransferase involved in cell wall biosynthesis [Pontibacter ummariensis]SNS55371.1 Glycosyltransferase involved in cell wall bisynthesis [Pontibacter ummariensis]